MFSRQQHRANRIRTIRIFHPVNVNRSRPAQFNPILKLVSRLPSNISSVA
jgi:hypothetical protein